MKTCFFCLLFLISTFPNPNFPTDSACWTTKSIGTGCNTVDPPPSCVQIVTNFVKGDTTINKLTYSIIYETLNCNTTLKGYIREDSVGKVFFKSTESMNIEVLLYNFNVELGDSVTINSSLTDTSEKRTVFVQGEEIGENSRVLYISYDGLIFTWTKGMGGEFGPLYTCYPCIGAIITMEEFSNSSSACTSYCRTETEQYPLIKSLFPSNAIAGIYPNPFNPSTVIEYYFHENNIGKIEILSLDGRIILEKQVSGSGKFFWNAKGLPGGLYFCRLTASGKTTTRKLVYSR